MSSDSSPPTRDDADCPMTASRHVDRFNHDEDASDYDDDVQRESDPIRAGYDELLDWVAAQVQDLQKGPILELGSGTGNLTLRLPERTQLVCVDISREMTRRLRDKLRDHRPAPHIEIADVLAYVRSAPEASYRAAVSTYTLHHLEEDEKDLLYGELRRILMPGGIFVVGDLMFENAEARRRRVELERQRGNLELADDIEDEFFWEIDRSLDGLRSVGFEVSPPVEFSDLSWGLAAHLAEDSGPGPKKGSGPLS